MDACVFCGRPLVSNATRLMFFLGLLSIIALSATAGGAEAAEGIAGVGALAAVAEDVFPTPEWTSAAPADVGLDESKLQQARTYALSGEGSGYIIRYGRLAMVWGSPTERYDLKSTTKSIGAIALGLAIQDGKIRLDDKVQQHHPAFGIEPEKTAISHDNESSGRLDQITILHLATQTAGFEKPGGYTRLIFEPGTKWAYSDGGPNWLAECITLAYKRDVSELMFDRVFGPLGIQRSDLTWRENVYRPADIDGIPRREFGSGISANVDAMARIGYLYLREGRWQGRQLIPKGFVNQARTTAPAVVGLPVVNADRYGNASDHYGLLWWNNADGSLPRVPVDAYWSWGLYDSLIVVIPSLDIVVARAGKSWKKDPDSHYDVLEPFLTPIANAASGYRSNAEAGAEAPCPPSPLIEAIEWAPASTIVRKARGSDNWPLTWADDDNFYTAYGDGWGFEPKVPQKLSLGLAKVSGPATEFVGINVRSETCDQIGDGSAGKKASGMLMVDGTLYMFTRNAQNSQLAWSTDHGKTWTWCPWRFTDSFGCPTFLNFGKNYAGARDEYVYVYSHDSDSAYEPADRMVLARVPKDRITEQAAYEFLHGVSKDGKPVWAKDVSKRGAVFVHEGRCYRSGITYIVPLRRYMWCQTIPGGDTREQGGFGIYDAPEPWGPWTTVYFTELWDVGPGETSSIPTKWVSADGTSLHIVFSGDDCFSVRKATLTLRR